MSDDAAKHYKVKIVEANLYVRKMTLNDDVLSAIEKTLFTSPASYPYLETLTKTFLASTGLHSWKQEDIFAREPIRRLAICLNTNEAFLGNNRQNPFNFRKFDLEQIYIYRNGLPVADSPISTSDDKRLYFNTISDLAYIDNGHGISLTEYPNHFIMVFDLTSTQQASHDFVHPELTNSSISIELKFSAALPNNIEIFIIGEKASKNVSVHFFNFPEKMNRNSFLNVNAATAENFGTHWLLLCRKNNQLLFADPLGRPISSYKHLYQRIISVGNNHNIYQLLENQPIQNANSKLCGLFCIYIAHFVFNAQKIVNISDNELIRFAFHMMF